MSVAAEPGRGRRSDRPGPRVRGSGPGGVRERGDRIVPAVQAGAIIHAPHRRAHSLMPYLLDPLHLHRAARMCMRRASSPGADRMTWAGYREGLRDRLATLAGQLRDGSWQPGPLRHLHIDTYTGKQLPAVIPTVADRVVHRAMRTALDPVLDAALPDWVSGYRPGRNRITAVRQAAAHMAAGRRWVVDVDVADASGGGSVEQVIDWLAELVADGSFLARVRTALTVLPSPLVPGTGLWPGLFNLRLLQVDRQLPELNVARFADNYALFARDKAEADTALYRVSHALAAAGLRPNDRKSRIRPPGRGNPEDLFLIDG